MKNVGITGVNGFIGSHLKNQLVNCSKGFKVIKFDKSFFENNNKLDDFVEKCDVIVHLAGVNRHPSSEYVFKKNVELAEKISNSIKKSKKKIHLIFSSSSQEDLKNEYGRAKKKSREEFIKLSQSSNLSFSGLIIPNVFGPFCKPNYNSFISTFSQSIIDEKEVQIIDDNSISLLHIDNLCRKIIEIIKNNIYADKLEISSDVKIKVSEVLKILKHFKKNYVDSLEIPNLKNKFEINLFNTFRSYLPSDFFPKKCIKHNDERGFFSELVKSKSGGQFSISMTKKNIERGNHFHTRKIERFIVIKGEAIVQFRKVGTKEVVSYKLSAKDSPTIIDIPVWTAHNIINNSENELITNFWISEIYNPLDSDTYPLNVRI